MQLLNYFVIRLLSINLLALMKRKAYTLEYKLSIIEHAKNTSNNAAAKSIKIPRSLVIDWRKQEQQIRENIEGGAKGNKKFRLSGGGRKLVSPELENDLYAWYEAEYIGEKIAVSRSRLIRKAKELYDLRHQEGEEIVLKFSKGWLDRFLSRYNIVQRRTTTVSQKPPADYMEKLISFIIYVAKKRQEGNYTDAMIYVADETAVWLDPWSPTTLAPRGSKDMPVTNCGYQKLNITVILTANGNGTKRLLYVIINRKRPIPEIEKQFRGKLVISWAGKSWMDDNLTEDYLRRVIGNNLFQRRLLVWDAFRCHISMGTKKILRSLKLDAAVIPGGCTRFLQPADVSWNRPFKAKILELHNSWMSDGNLPMTRTGANIAPPSSRVYLQWIYEAWSAISTEVIKHSFIACGITTASDGTEDDRIHAFKQDGPIPLGFTELKERRNQFLDPIVDFQELENESINILLSIEDEDVDEDNASSYDSDTSYWSDNCS